MIHKLSWVDLLANLLRQLKICSTGRQSNDTRFLLLKTCNLYHWCGLRPSVLGQNRSETKKSVLVLVLQVWCCVVKHGLVTLVVIMILKDTTTFQILFIVSLFCIWNITTVGINSSVHLLKSYIRQLPLFTSGGLGHGLVILVLVLRNWSRLHHWSVDY